MLLALDIQVVYYSLKD